MGALRLPRYKAFYEHDKEYGKTIAFAGSDSDVRLTFGRCFNWVTSFKVVTADGFNDACLCLHDHDHGGGLTRCFPHITGTFKVDNLVPLGIDNLPSAFTWRSSQSADCIAVPHHPVHKVQHQRSLC